MKRYIAIAMVSPGFWKVVQMPGQRIINGPSWSWAPTEEGKAKAEAAAKTYAKMEHLVYAGEERP